MSIDQLLADSSLIEERKEEIKAALRAKGIDPARSIKDLSDAEWLIAHPFLEGPVKEKLARAQRLLQQEQKKYAKALGWTLTEALEVELQTLDATLGESLFVGLSTDLRDIFEPMFRDLFETMLRVRGLDPKKRCRELSAEEALNFSNAMIAFKTFESLSLPSGDTPEG